MAYGFDARVVGTEFRSYPSGVALGSPERRKHSSDGQRPSMACTRTCRTPSGFLRVPSKIDGRCPSLRCPRLSGELTPEIRNANPATRNPPRELRNLPRELRNPLREPRNLPTSAIVWQAPAIRWQTSAMLWQTLAIHLLIVFPLFRLANTPTTSNLR